MQISENYVNDASMSFTFKKAHEEKQYVDFVNI